MIGGDDDVGRVMLVVDLLLKDGYTVRALPNTLRGLSADAAVISTYLKSVAGPVVLAFTRHARRSNPHS
jgi:hypothetical protein